jgi:uncharacterized protein (TIGR01777 family)
MRILVSGATGLVGRYFSNRAQSAGHHCVTLTRRPRNEGDVGWDPQQHQLDPMQLSGFDAVVHLAGDNIAKGRWSPEKKRRIRDSRVQGTLLLCQTLAQLDDKPTAMVSASAIGYYGSRGDELLTEQSPPGSGFLADVCREWEQATQPAVDAGIRVANARIGVVLAADGGALKPMLIPFRLGVGGVVGDGRQYWSWIAIDDLAAALLFILQNSNLSQAVNLVGPRPVNNREFTKVLGQVLKRPTFLPMPAFVARLALGEMADELLLSSTRVEPTKLTEAGYGFQYADLKTALRSLLGR